MVKDLPRVKHLVLLVGSNPLPNVVAGKLLIQPGGTISLIHSKDSAPVAEKLKAWLEKNYEKKVFAKLVEVDESCPRSIYGKVKEQLDKIRQKGNIDSVGLNYTGGTKMMSVQAYRAVEWWAQKEKITPQFSYLDAKTLNMVFDPYPSEEREEERKYVGLSVKLCLEDLLDLHGRKIGNNNPPNREILLPNTAKRLAMHSNDTEGFIKSWNKWVDRQKDKDELDASNKEYFRYAIITNDNKKKIEGAIIDVFKVLKGELNVSESKVSLKQSKFKNKIITDLKQWLTGGWLEHYVLNILNSLAADLKLHDCFQIIKTKGFSFEVDVVAVRGYQLFSFSCKAKTEKYSRNERKESKLALFEAYIRAQQLGGDEARVALVCCVEDPAGLEEEIRQTVDLRDRIKVFGREHLKKLDENIKRWIESQKGEEKGKER